MRYLKKILFLIAVIFISALISCKEGVPRETHGNSEAEHKILVTGTTSEFKEAVLARIIEEYSPTHFMEIMPYSDLKGIDYADYSAIIIFDECQAWMAFNGKIKRLLRKIENKDRLIPVITAGDPDWEYTYEGIEAITSASEKEKVSDVAGMISAKIRELTE